MIIEYLNKTDIKDFGIKEKSWFSIQKSYVKLIDEMSKETGLKKSELVQEVLSVIFSDKETIEKIESKLFDKKIQN